MCLFVHVSWINKRGWHIVQAHWHYIPRICKQFSLQWRHNERHDISNHRRLDCLFNRVFRRRSTKTSKLHVTGLCEGNPPMTAVDSRCKRPITRKIFPFDDVIMLFWLQLPYQFGIHMFRVSISFRVAWMTPAILQKLWDLLDTHKNNLNTPDGYVYARPEMNHILSPLRYAKQSVGDEASGLLTSL